MGFLWTLVGFQENEEDSIFCVPLPQPRCSQDLASLQFHVFLSPPLRRCLSSEFASEVTELRACWLWEAGVGCQRQLSLGVCVSCLGVCVSACVCERMLCKILFQPLSTSAKSTQIPLRCVLVNLTLPTRHKQPPRPIPWNPFHSSQWKYTIFQFSRNNHFSNAAVRMDSLKRCCSQAGGFDVIVFVVLKKKKKNRLLTRSFSNAVILLVSRLSFPHWPSSHSLALKREHKIAEKWNR